MKKLFRYLFLFSIIHQPSTILPCYAQFGAMPPFVFDIQPVVTNGIPGMHSFAFAQRGNKWLVIGGRINGLHGMSSNDGFDPTYSNNLVVVIDTSTWTSYTSSLSNLPYSVADPLRSTNMQYFADTACLYIFGGFGRDSILNRFVTFPVVSAIRIDSMINAVITGQNISPYIRQITDTNFRVCGGELGRIGNDYYLCFGHDFEGRYTDPPTPLFTQVYSNEIKKFNIADNGTVFSIQNFTTQIDTDNYHRRDLNLVPEIKPGTGEVLGAYAGVFQKTQNIPWKQPMTITGLGTTVHAYQQTMNHYTCMHIPIYDSVTQKMYVTFFGGISLNDYDPQTNTITQDTLVPFIGDVTTFRKDPGGSMEETILPLQMRGLIGANAVYVPRQNISAYANEVVRFRDLPGQRTLVGYLFGGIRATGTNLLPSSANDTIYRVFITPNFFPGFEEVNSDIDLFSVFPNPAYGTISIQFDLRIEEHAEISVFDLAGKRLKEIFNGRSASGLRVISWDTELAPGMYFLQLRTENSCLVLKLVLE